MKCSYAAIQAQNNADYIVNIEDDMICRKKWLIQLHQTFVHHKTSYGNDAVPLIVTGYNSNFTADSIVSVTPKCTPPCLWKRLVYGPNYFLDNVTLQTVIQPAFSPNYQAWGGERPEWANSLDAWDNWVLDEYYAAHKKLIEADSTVVLPPGVLVVTPSVLQHVEHRGSMHMGNHDVALDFVDSADDEQTRSIVDEQTRNIVDEQIGIVNSGNVDSIRPPLMDKSIVSNPLMSIRRPKTNKWKMSMSIRPMMNRHHKMTSRLRRF